MNGYASFGKSFSYHVIFFNFLILLLVNYLTIYFSYNIVAAAEFQSMVHLILVTHYLIDL